MSKTFLLNLLLLLTVNILIKPLYAFGVDLQIQNQLGASYGLYFALWNFTALFQIFADLGLQQYNNKEVASNTNFFYANLPKILQIKAMLSFLMIALTLVVAIIVGYQGGDLRLLYALLFSQLCISLTLFLRTNISGLGYFKIDSLLSSLDKFLLLIFGLFLLHGGLFERIDIYHFAYMQNLAYGITAFLTSLLVFIFYKRGYGIDKKSFSLSFGNIFAQSWAYAAAVLLMLIYTRIDVILLERTLPIELGRKGAEIYAFVYRFYDMFTMVGFLFASLLLPMYAKVQNDKIALKNLAFLGSSLLTIFNIGVMTLMFIFKDKIVFHEAQLSAFALLLALPAGGLIQIWGTLLTALNRLKKGLILFSIAIALNIGLNLYLIPSYGVAGIAFTAFLTQTLVGLVQWIWGLYILEVKIEKSIVAKWTIFLFAIGLLYYCSEYYLRADNFLANMFIYGVLYTLLSLITGVFSPKKLLILLRQKA